MPLHACHTGSVCRSQRTGQRILIHLPLESGNYLKKFPIKRVIAVADWGLLSTDNLANSQEIVL